MEEHQRLHIYRKISPCQNCTERFTACHDRCPKDLRGEIGYKAWKEENKAINEERRCVSSAVQSSPSMITEPGSSARRNAGWRRMPDISTNGEKRMGKAKMIGLNKTYIPNNKRDRKKHPFKKGKKK